MQVISTGEGKAIRTFSNYESFIAKAFESSVMRDSERASRRVSQEKWSGGSWDHAKNTAISGDRLTASKLRAGIIKEANRVMGQVPRLDPVYRDDGGIWIDVSRYLSGEPEAFGDMVDQSNDRTSKKLDLIIDCGASWRAKASDYENTGKLIAGSVLGLRAAGYFVTLHIAFKFRGDNPEHHNCFVFPLSGRNGFDVSKLAAVFSVWFFRRIVFSLMECMDPEFRKQFGVGDYYGKWPQDLRITEQESRLIAGHSNSRVLRLRDFIGQPEETIREALITKELTKTGR